MSIRVITADVMDGLAQLADESVHCCVTSPPYWMLRDYGYEGQIGLEPTVAAHVAAMVAVFGEVRRVLRKDGTLWLNYGDIWAGSWGAGSRGHETAGTLQGGSMLSARQIRGHPKRTKTGSMKRFGGLKPKDLVLMPERIALALQSDGWWVRDRVIWHKPNPMPSSVKDRCTPSYEIVWQLSTSARYYFDARAIAEPRTSDEDAPLTRNRRNVWTIATEPYRGGHFATMPTELARLCILAGCPANGTVLDPFAGAGTTGLVADRMNRNAVLIEMSPEYVEEHIKPRVAGDRKPLVDMMDPIITA